MISKKVVVMLVIALIVMWMSSCDARSHRYRKYKNERKMSKNAITKQSKQIYNTRETNTPNFLRLLLMRLVYGVAAQFGFEERVAGFLNGAFVPPNADEDDFGFSFESDENIVGALDFGDFL